MKLNPNTTSALAITILLLGGGYWYFSSSDEGNEPPLIEGLVANPAQIRFETLVSELQSIKFDTNLFKDAKFNSLTDIATQVSPESSGRTDPFAPVAGISN